MTTKNHILALLESNRGQAVSGEHIAGRLGVSRNAVWKAVRELEKDGYKIIAAPNKGYCLSKDNDILSVQGIQPHLREPSERIFVYDSVESTNKAAKEMAISGAEHGTVIIADSQTAGKGRYGRYFFSPPGHGVYMSLVLREFRFSLPTLATSFAAVCVCEAIEAVSGKIPRIKWVNDILLDGRKICGILTEAVTDFESGGIQWIVVGIGINTDVSEMDFPEDLRQTAGSVFANGSAGTTRNHLAAEIINRILAPENQYSEKEMLEKYRQRLLWIREKVLVSRTNETFEATALDIDETGRLLVRRDNGEILSLSSGEIKISHK